MQEKNLKLLSEKQKLLARPNPYRIPNRILTREEALMENQYKKYYLHGRASIPTCHQSCWPGPLVRSRRSRVSIFIPCPASYAHGTASTGKSRRRSHGANGISARSQRQHRRRG